MADVNKADAERPPNLTVNFSLGDEESPEKTETTDETTTKDSENAGKKKNKSRFKVALVEFKDDEKPAKDDDLSPPTSPNPTDTYGNTHGNTHYDTNNLKTFGRNTLETLPHLDHYRNLLSATGAMRKRPTLLELHENDAKDEEELMLPEAENGHARGHTPAREVCVETATPQHSQQQALKFGWIKGVLIRCLLNIYGVMLFLRLSWIVGQAGIGLTTAIILLAAVVTTITALSMSAICTNGDVKGGGAYFMISRSLGPEFGGAIGVIFSVANAVAVAMYVVGFAETIRDILKQYDCLMVDEINDVRIIGVITAVGCLGVTIIGMQWEARAQIVLLGILIIAILAFVVGTFLTVTESEAAVGLTGYKVETFKENFGPEFRDGYSFFSVFAIFFPAATGILAGANISGDLEDAQSAIPKGTLLAILITSITYIAMAWMSGAVFVRDALGPVMANVTANASLVNLTSYSAMAVTQSLVIEQENATLSTAARSCEAGECQYGLLNDMQAALIISAFGPIIIAGIISATLSSALASLVSAPKVFQAVCKDKIFPYIHVFAKGYGKNEEPWRAYGLAFMIAIGFILIGQLNAIAPLISNFFLMSYALINYSCFDASLAKSPGWRPAFKYYSMWMSLLGALLCLIVMFIINWWTALITFVLTASLYVFVHYRKPDINWGSSTQAHVYRNSLQHTLKLVSVMEHVKNFRPQLLVLTGFPSDRPALVDFASTLSKNTSLMVCGQVVIGEPQEKLKDFRFMAKMAHSWLAKRKAKSFYNGVTARDIRSGTQALMQSCGVGKLKPNTLILGFKNNWRTCDPKEMADYYNIIHDAFDLHYGVGMLRLQEGLDFSHLSQHGAQLTEDNNVLDHHSIASAMTSFYGGQFWSSRTCPAKLQRQLSATPSGDENRLGLPMVPSKSSDLGIILPTVPSKASDLGNVSEDSRSGSTPHLEPPACDQAAEKKQEDGGTEMKVLQGGDNNEVVTRSNKNINMDALKESNIFYKSQKRGNIDVWWLFDDGGLTLLIPYLLMTKSQWSHCKLRVFMAGTKRMELGRDQRHMATLLSKFRIEYSSMTVIPDIGKKPHAEHIQEFDERIKPLRMMSPDETEETHSWKISDHEYLAQKDKTYRHIRIRELLMQHSRDASLIVMSLPMPRKGLCSAGLYMSWIDEITRDMPPILLIRGNQDSVLTYYS